MGNERLSTVVSFDSGAGAACSGQFQADRFPCSDVSGFPHELAIMLAVPFGFFYLIKQPVTYCLSISQARTATAVTRFDWYDMEYF